MLHGCPSRLTWPLQYRLSSSTNSSASLWWFGVTFRGNMHSAGSPLPCWQVAEHLVVGAVLLDDVDDVLDRARVADLGGDRRLDRVRGGRELLVRVRAVAVHLGRVLLELLVVRDRDDRQGPVHGRCRCTGTAAGAPRPRSARSSSVNGFGLRLQPLPTPTSRVLPSGLTATAVGYQPVGMNPLTADRRGAPHIDDGDAVVVRVGDVQRLAVRAQGQGVRRAPLRGLREQGRRRWFRRRARASCR